MLRIPELCHPIRKHYRTIIALGFALMAGGGWLASKLKVDSDFAALLPDSFESVQALKAMAEEVAGGGSTLRIALKSQDFEALMALAEQLARRFEASEYVSSVDWQSDRDFYERHALLFLEPQQLDSLYDEIQSSLDRERQAVNPFMVDDLFGDPPAGSADAGGDVGDKLAELEQLYESELPSRHYVNPDSTVLVLTVNPVEGGTGLGYARRMVADARRIIAEAEPTSFAPDMEVYYGSNVKNRIDEYETIMRDILGTAGYGVTGVFLVLAIVFRSPLSAFLVSLSLFASLTWTFGLTYLLIGQLNTITGFLFVVLFGMGVDYGIHAMARYRESRQAGVDVAGAIHRMVCLGGSALVTTALTTSAAFFSLMLLEFRGFSELGLITGIGMIFAVTAMIVFLPALVIAAENLGLLKIKPVEGKALTATKGPLTWARPVLAGAVVLLAVSAVLFSKVQFQYDFTNLRIITQEREEYARETTGVFTQSESPALVLAPTPEALEEVVAAVEEIIRTDTLSPTVESVRSILSLVPPDQEVRLEKIAALKRLVEEEVDGRLGDEDQARVDRLKRFLEVDQPYTWDDFPAKDRLRFANREGEPGNFALIYPSVALRDGRNAIAFRDDIGTIQGESGAVYHAASSNIIVADMLSMITKEGPLAVLLSVGVVFLIILANLRYLKGTLLVMTPLVFGIVWMGGAMYLMGMELNFFNLVVFPSLVGIGIDDGVHIYHRYREEGPGSLPFVLQRTGMPVLVTTITSCVGYSGLLFAHHPGLQSIGKLAIVGLTATFVSAYFVLPALLEIFGAGRKQEA
jgi:predicted RND superfamily exporter protein